MNLLQKQTMAIKLAQIVPAIRHVLRRRVMQKQALGGRLRARIAARRAARMGYPPQYGPQYPPQYGYAPQYSAPPPPQPQPRLVPQTSAPLPQPSPVRTSPREQPMVHTAPQPVSRSMGKPTVYESPRPRPSSMGKPTVYESPRPAPKPVTARTNDGWKPAPHTTSALGGFRFYGDITPQDKRLMFSNSGGLKYDFGNASPEDARQMYDTEIRRLNDSLAAVRGPHGEVLTRADLERYKSVWNQQLQALNDAYNAHKGQRWLTPPRESGWKPRPRPTPAPLPPPPPAPTRQMRSILEPEPEWI